MEIKDYVAQCHCGVCGEPADKAVEMQVDIKIPWDQPTWGSFGVDGPQKAIAIMCRPCAVTTSVTNLKEVVEFQDGYITYHAITWENGIAKLTDL